MNVHRRYGAAALLVALAVGCGFLDDAPYGGGRGTGADRHLAGPATPRPAARPESPPAHSAHPAHPAHTESPPAHPGAKPFTLVASGDVIASYPSVLDTARQDAGGSGYEYRRILAGVRPVIEHAGLAVCHLETPLGPPGGPFTGYPVFKAPPQVADALRATGYDSCSTASNHTLDDGEEGVRRTLDVLDQAGLRHVGSARDAAEAARPAMLTAPGGARVAQLSYTYGTNGVPLPDGKPWTVNPIDARRIVADARAARRAGADIVLVSPHWGTEYQTAPDEQQLSVARAITAARTAGRPDIDLVIGTHAHTPQPYEKVNGTWVVYGMGDQIAGIMESERGNWGTIARFRFAPPEGEGRRWRVTSAEYIPQLSDHGPPLRMVDLTATRRFPDVREEIREAVLSRGAARDGLTEGR
ncbi:CapA family protein [Streptomyces sp. MST-110588]|uniref:CapA family protein n=1 Tax=Streptomyces sp. MST-110588 TaxID=2833628 RepID=UPI001F5C35B3|nr:CapA family protein [Streptomyces sp. MST-110588]UNO43169.1 CapA family protein [Streptomyces sp. MST-110588]